jgi:hypothetical protein
MKEPIEPIEEDLDFSDEGMYASFDAFKTLIDAGVTRAEALKRTGLTEQIVRDLELEEEEMSFKSEFEDRYDTAEMGDDDEFDDFDKWNDDEFGDDDDFGDEKSSYDSGFDEY